MRIFDERGLRRAMSDLQTGPAGVEHRSTRHRRRTWVVFSGAVTIAAAALHLSTFGRSYPTPPPIMAVVFVAALLSAIGGFWAAGLIPGLRVGTNRSAFRELAVVIQTFRALWARFPGGVRAGIVLLFLYTSAMTLLCVPWTTLALIGRSPAAVEPEHLALLFVRGGSAAAFFFALAGTVCFAYPPPEPPSR